MNACGESKVLALLSETFAQWGQNIQVFECLEFFPKLDALSQFCNETIKFVELGLQHMRMDLIPEIDDVTSLLQNLQRNHQVIRLHASPTPHCAISMQHQTMSAVRAKSLQDQRCVPPAHL
jgi:hypothetical protein